MAKLTLGEQAIQGPSVLLLLVQMVGAQSMAWSLPWPPRNCTAEA
ncbi:hypothetical protein [Deinococcus alpinitundrae]|nr:hypothetical protein [Deinococcus alpinitundrae]